jgi:hypothetical protein
MSQFGFCRRTAVDSLLDLDIACVLVVDDRRMDLICCSLRYGFWSCLNATNGYIFLYSTMDLYKDMDNDGMSSFSI